MREYRQTDTLAYKNGRIIFVQSAPGVATVSELQSDRESVWVNEWQGLPQTTVSSRDHGKRL